MAEPILRVVDVTKRFGGLTAVRNLSFEVPAHTIKAIIGPNGAGKTTLFNLISGFERVTGGEIHFCSQSLTRLRPEDRPALGIGRTFQNVQIFENMTVLENVMTGRHPRTRTGLVGALLRLPGARAEERRIRAHAEALLELVGLAAKAREPASELAFGELKLLEIARALAMDPELLLLDEPVAGLTPEETDRVVALIACLKQQGLTILLVEHNMRMVMGISTEVLVLNYGEKIAESAPDVVRNDPRVIEAYLGKGVFELAAR